MFAISAEGRRRSFYETSQITIWVDLTSVQFDYWVTNVELSWKVIKGAKHFKVVVGSLLCGNPFITDYSLCSDKQLNNELMNKQHFTETQIPKGALLGILGGGVPSGSPNPDPISDQKMLFFTPVFRPGL